MIFGRTVSVNQYRWARLHETRSELKPVSDLTSRKNLTSVWGNFIISVHMTSGGVNFTLVQISLRSNWPKWNFKPQWVFRVNARSEIKLRRIIEIANQCACTLILGYKHKFSYFMRAINCISHLMSPVEKII